MLSIVVGAFVVGTSVICTTVVGIVVATVSSSVVAGIVVGFATVELGGLGVIIGTSFVVRRESVVLTVGRTCAGVVRALE